MGEVRVTVLVDNYVRRQGLLAEHGWACWVETPAGRVLFDTGQGWALWHNVRELGIALETADALVLSHGHYDHTGALAGVLERAPGARVYAHPAALDAKYGRSSDGRVRAIGVPQEGVGVRARLAPRLVPTRGPTEIGPGVWVTGEVPRVTDFERPSGGFYLDAAEGVPDPVLDDQALLLHTAAGIVVVLGCAHAGVVNTLQFVRTLQPREPIAAVLGGMHLSGASEERILRTVEALAALDVREVVPAHCTGQAARAKLAAGLPGRCLSAEVGAVFEFSSGEG
ncbi:MAG TPA: MBL fold metallo-hydrolase [Phycisphaerae bacterium]|nr:MBL fold metallo-hydrolase [Phycisphaerae bacterium]HNU45070.1 MBL fold metallo-hydrolase [Phycisphaerae bacterium]